MWCPPRIAFMDTTSSPSQYTREASTRIAAQHRFLKWFDCIIICCSVTFVVQSSVRSSTACNILQHVRAWLLQENVWIHPEYSANTKNNDLSIITLYTPFTLNSNVATMPLAASTATFNAGTSCTVSGWGDTVEGTRLNSASNISLILIVGCCRRFDFRHVAICICLDCGQNDV